MSTSRICYVIMPFDQRYQATYTDAVRLAVQKVGQERGEQWECRRGDDVRVPGSVTKEIVTSLHTAELIIADLSGSNPNVFYELGVAHSAARPTIMITQDIETLPFDINSYRVHAYSASPDGLRILSERLSAAILDVLSSKEHITNPIQDFAPIRHAEVILSLEGVRRRESLAQSEVWVIEPSLDTDLKMFGDIIKLNLLDRGIKYRYLVPRTREVVRQWERFVRNLGYDRNRHGTLEVRTVEPYLIESEVVVYDAYTEREDVMIMSPREHEFVFWYRVGRTRGESIRDRFDTLWDKVSEVLSNEMT